MFRAVHFGLMVRCPPKFPREHLLIDFVGPNWPAGGEIDIVEGIHDNTNNQAALHTVDGCSMGTDFSRMDGQSVTSGSCLSTPESK